MVAISEGFYWEMSKIPKGVRMSKRENQIKGVLDPSSHYATMLQTAQVLVTKLLLEYKHENSTFWKMSYGAVSDIAVVLNTNFNSKKAVVILTFAENINSKRSGMS